jgi:hypothetical protein
VSTSAFSQRGKFKNSIHWLSRKAQASIRRSGQSSAESRSIKIYQQTAAKITFLQRLIWVILPN